MRQPLLQRIARLLGVLLALAGLGGGAYWLHTNRADLRPDGKAEPAPEPTGEVRGADGPGAFVGAVVAHHTVDLSAKYGGLLERVHVRLGDTVVSKQKIATLDDASVKHEISRAKAALAAARASSRKAAIQAKAAKNRYRRRVKAAGTFSKEVLSTARSQAELARVRRAEAMAGVAQGAATISNLNEKLQSAVIRAPFAGKVAAIYQKPGTNVGAGQPIVRLITANDMWVRFAVPRKDLAQVKVHGAVTVKVQVVGANLQGVIKHVAPEIDPASQMIFVEAQLVVPKRWSGRIPAGAMARISMADK